MNFVISYLISTHWKKDSYKSILIIINELTKIIHYKSIKVIINPLGLGEMIIDIVRRHYGVSESIVIG